jgi:hypothetical protein
MVGKKAAKVAAGKQGAPTYLHDEELSKDTMQGRIPLSRVSACPAAFLSAGPRKNTQVKPPSRLWKPIRCGSM